MSFVYGIRALPTGPVKIGFATDVDKRVKALQCGSHAELQCIWYAVGFPMDERNMHRFFTAIRLRGEWFDFGTVTNETVRRKLKDGMERVVAAREAATKETMEWFRPQEK